jgi:uncharacterized protein
VPQKKAEYPVNRGKVKQEGSPMEFRKFGKTGMMTSLLGFGGFHLLEIPLAEAEKLLGGYLDAGGNYIETALSYGDGESERKIGRSVMHRRNEFILVSKIGARDKAAAQEAINTSLANLKTDHLDVLLMHGVPSLKELDIILGEGGAYEAALEAKMAGKIHFIGISMHGWPGALKEALLRERFDAIMTTVNYYDRFNYPEIEDELLPLANQKGAGIILMKPLADGYLYRNAALAFQYAFSRPVSVVVTGINNKKMLSEDIAWANAYTKQDNKDETALLNASELGNYVCRRCGLCTCPLGIDIREVFACEGMYDRQMGRGVVQDTADYALTERLRFWYGNRELARVRYAQMSKRGDGCNGCGACLSQCPYHIDIPFKIRLSDYKLAGREIY